MSDLSPAPDSFPDCWPSHFCSPFKLLFQPSSLALPVDFHFPLFPCCFLTSQPPSVFFPTNQGYCVSGSLACTIIWVFSYQGSNSGAALYSEHLINILRSPRCLLLVCSVWNNLIFVVCGCTQLLALWLVQL